MVRDDDQAVAWFRKSVNKGESWSWFHDAYLRRGATDDVKGRAWWHKLAESGNAGAQYVLGMMNRRGAVEVGNADEAAAWLRKAAVQIPWGMKAAAGCQESLRSRDGRTIHRAVCHSC